LFVCPSVDLLLGDATKAKEKLGWESGTSFDDLVKEMVEADLAMIRGHYNEVSAYKLYICITFLKVSWWFLVD